MTSSKDVPVETDLAIRRMIARYCHLVDDRDFDAVAEMFTDDARFRLLETDLHGKDAIKEYLNTTPDPMFHHVSNVVVSNGSHPSTYHAISDLMMGGKNESGWVVWMIARYHDTLTGEGRDIRFSQRIVTSR
jgi:ketosteroid isomerase-like protein